MDKVLDCISVMATRSPDAIAFCDQDACISYAALDQKIDVCAAYVERYYSDKRIGLMIEDVFVMLCLFWACLRLGKDVYVINNRYGTFSKTNAKHPDSSNIFASSISFSASAFSLALTVYVPNL